MNIDYLVVSVPTSANALRNLEHGLATSTWAFPTDREWYPLVKAGTIVLMGAMYDHPGGNRNPRKQTAEYALGTMGAIFVARATGEIRPAGSPHWPDELAEGRVVYTERFPMSPLFQVSDVPLSSLPSDIVEAFRLSHIRGDGRLVSTSNQALLTLQKEAGIAASVGAVSFADTPGVSTSTALPKVRGRRGAGRRSDAAANAAVERRAVDVAITHYEAAGWKVEELGKPYDLRCTNSDDELHVEVKGSTGEAATVSLTDGEVRHAAAYPTDLFIVSGITLDRSTTPPIGHGGKATVFLDWTPDSQALRPRQFDYEVPWEDGRDPDEPLAE